MPPAPTVGQCPAEVFAFQHLAELLGSPIRDQELEPGTVAEAAVTIVPVDLDDRLPDVRHVIACNPGAEALGHHGIGRQAPAHHRSKPGPSSGCSTPTKDTQLISWATS